MIESITNLFLSSMLGSLSWLYQSITFQVPWQQNYFWGLIVISLIVLSLETLFPWRKKQKILRRDFFLDTFYMFFNFFIFTVLISGFYELITTGLNSMNLSAQSLSIFSIAQYPQWLQVLIFFILLDFLQWLTHIALHRFSFLWRFHRVHHSVKEMGYAAHLRFHWMENILYRPAKFLGVMLIGGFEPSSAFIAHFIAITIGHLNHSNIKLSYGPFKYLLNNPVMHLHHHAYELPAGSIGKNFGISLSLWDYIFRTNYIPNTHGQTKLGFKGDEEFPKGFIAQNLSGFKYNNK